MHPEHVCADELASGDLDELQKIMKVREELKQLQEAIRQDELASISAVVPCQDVGHVLPAPCRPSL